MVTATGQRVRPRSEALRCGGESGLNLVRRSRTTETAERVSRVHPNLVSGRGAVPGTALEFDRVRVTVVTKERSVK